jgi:hypothetical protein
MTMEEDILGSCLECDTPIPESLHLLTYESAETIVVLARCPACQTITYLG